MLYVVLWCAVVCCGVLWCAVVLLLCAVVLCVVCCVLCVVCCVLCVAATQQWESWLLLPFVRACSEFLTTLTFGALHKNHIVSTTFEDIAKKHKK